MNYSNTQYKVFKFFNSFVLFLMAAIMLFPYINVLAKAFNDGMDTMLGGITFYPRVPTLNNFKVIIGSQAVLRAGAVSILRVLIGTSLALVVQFSAAYAFTRKSLRGRSMLMIYLMIPMYFGGGLIPIYLVYSKLSLLNNFLVYVLPCAFSLYNMVIIRTYLYTIPKSLEESAKLDGANEFTILLRIILPLSRPIIATVALWTAVYHWNDWTTTLYFVTDSRKFTLQFILMQMLKETERIAKMIEESIKSGMGPVRVPTTSPEAIKSAQIVITTIPIILIYPFLQKYFIKGVIIGAIKD